METVLEPTFLSAVVCELKDSPKSIALATSRHQSNDLMKQKNIIIMVCDATNAHPNQAQTLDIDSLGVNQKVDHEKEATEHLDDS